MKRSEALQIVEMIKTAWPDLERWSDAETEAYADAVEGSDAAEVTSGVARAAKELRFAPTPAELSEYARIEGKVQEQWRDSPTVANAPPGWVQRWKRARFASDYRPFPEQALALREQGHETLDVPYTDREAWVQEDEYLSGPMKAPPKTTEEIAAARSR